MIEPLTITIEMVPDARDERKTSVRVSRPTNREEWGWAVIDLMAAAVEYRNKRKKKK